MGRMRKRFNAKARSNDNQVQSIRTEETVKVDINVDKQRYDESNPLIISGSKKKAEKLIKAVQPTKKILTKKQRKALQKVLERKEKKINRTELFEKLSKVQAKPEELKFLTSTSHMQTLGLKRYADFSPERPISKKTAKINNIKGINKKAKLDLKTLSGEDSSSDSDSSEIECKVNEETSKSIEQHPIFESTIIKPSTEQNNPSGTPTIPSSNTSVSGVNEPKSKELVKNTKTVNRKPAVFVTLNRKPEVQAAREALPIFCEEQSIIEAIKENPVVIIHGETGSGKTTQVPQFLYEAGYTQSGKIIGITEPRRIAAISMAARVGEEMNTPEKVSYHVRYDNTVNKETEIKFMTDGVLLLEVKLDCFLSKYSVIIIDEAHERSMFSDILIGLLSKIILIREKRKDPLKLIIMSATMRVQDFLENTRLFKVQPFLIRLESRQHRVQVYFNKKTRDDYIRAAYDKVCAIHKDLPPGAILVFLTGQQEVKTLCRDLQQTFSTKNKQAKLGDQNVPVVTSAHNKRKNKKKTEAPCEPLALPPDINLDEYSIEPKNSEDVPPHEEDGNIDGNFKTNDNKYVSPLYTLPLFSVLPAKEQEKIFKPPPAGSRLCVVSTNVAETSITIPGLKYVVDSGKVKNLIYNNNNDGISKYEIVWCSKASSNQRAGRCGRTEGGHCYRLYSSSVFEDSFPDYSLPEIQTMPVDGVLLQMKALGINQVVEFPFPTPPDRETLKAAEKRLVILGALEDLKKEGFKNLAKWEFSAKITPLGEAMSQFTLSPRYAKMLLLSNKHKCIPHIVAVACALTVPELFVTSTVTIELDGEEAEKVVQEGIHKIGAGTGASLRLGDMMVLLRAISMFKASKNGAKFCTKYGIRYKAMSEIHQMALQQLNIMSEKYPGVSKNFDMEICPTDEQVETIRKIVAACLTDHVARKMSRDETKDDKSLKNAYKCIATEAPVFIHPSSTMFQRLPEFVVYNEIVESSKLYMRGIAEIEAEWLPAFAPYLCSFSAPCEDPPPSFDRTSDKLYCHVGGTFGPWSWQLPVVKVEMEKGLERYSWFCFFLLDGQVYKFFKNYKQHYLSTPSTMLKTWAKLLPRTRYLLQAIIGKEVDSQESLQKVWKKDPKYLLREFWEWLPLDKHTEVEIKWPPNCD